MPSIATAELVPVIGYVRVSTWREEKISNQIQMDAIQEAAARRGRYVAKWIEDLDESGRHFKRKIMQGIELIEANDNPLREIWVWKFSRFGRNRHGVAINLARIEHVGGELISATEDIDATTAVGEFTRDMLFAVAAFESNRAGEQWRETHELRRAMGLPATGRKRFGYRWHPRRIPDGEGGWTLQDEWYQVLAEQAEVAYEGYTTYIAGKTGFKKLAQRWTGLGMVNAWGHPWQDQAVKTYLDSGFAAGLLRAHKRDVRCMSTHRCLKLDHWEYRPAEHEAIITGEEWEAFRDRREVRKGTPRRSLAPVYPLSGLVFCGVCRKAGREARCQLHSSGGYVHGAYYRCGMNSRGHVSHDPVRNRRDAIELEVYNWLMRVSKEIDDIAAGRIVIPKPRTNPDDKVKRKRLTSEIAKLAAALDRATEGHALGDIPRDSYLRTRDRIIGKRDAAQEKLDALPKAEAPQPGPMLHREKVKGLIKEWDTISVESKRVMLGSLIRRIEMGLDKAVEVVPVWAPADKPFTVIRKARRGA
ncbi:recombinase family protein [Streptomyces violaceusniger]|uniref:recombinase family protein n=1 Tax=Streptomyces violaceusniger TaxID=68280 RepID=UPI00131D55CF|nr:recombinase family protein [Streptomyces hygroscopicus]